MLWFPIRFPPFPADVHIRLTFSALFNAKAGVYVSDPITISDDNKN